MLNYLDLLDQFPANDDALLAFEQDAMRYLDEKKIGAAVEEFLVYFDSK